MFVLESEVLIIHADYFLAALAFVSELIIVTVDTVRMTLFVHKARPVKTLVTVPTREVLSLAVVFVATASTARLFLVVFLATLVIRLVELDLGGYFGSLYIINILLRV
jgi:hypothetical protein